MAIPIIIAVVHLGLVRGTKMNTAPYWNKKICSDCKRMRCQKGCNCDCHQLRDRIN